MNTLTRSGISEVMEAGHLRPAVSVILPFNPKMSPKAGLMHSLETAVEKVQKQLLEEYPGDLSMLVIHRLKNIVASLNFNTHKKSVAIYVSPVFEKVLYLDISVDEKIMVDRSFEIRDLVYSKKHMHQYLVLLLGCNETRIFLGNTGSFSGIVSSTHQSICSYINKGREIVINFCDIQQHKEIMTYKFLHQVDNALDIVLNAYPLPLFVLGTHQIASCFKKLTRHTAAVIDYIPGNFGEATAAELKTVLEPYIADWEKVRNREIQNQLEEAASRNKLAVGMHDVWHEAMNHHGKLLLVEKDYMYAAEQGVNRDTIFKASAPYNKFSYINDAVDDVIEKVLENGGDVEFTDKEVLDAYHHIALVQN